MDKTVVQLAERVVAGWFANAVRRSGKTQRQIGDELGLPHARISEIMNGKRRPSAGEVLLLAGILDIDTPNIRALKR